jgi:hypothetical protein
MIKQFCDVTNKEVISHEENFVAKRFKKNYALNGNKVFLDINLNINDDTRSSRGHVGKEGLITLLELCLRDLKKRR